MWKILIVVARLIYLVKANKKSPKYNADEAANLIVHELVPKKLFGSCG